MLLIPHTRFQKEVVRAAVAVGGHYEIGCSAHATECLSVALASSAVRDGGSPMTPLWAGHWQGLPRRGAAPRASRLGRNLLL